MALFNEILVGRYNNGLRRLLGMKGGAPSPQVNGDIQAGIELESDRVEWFYLRGETIAFGFSSQPATAAERSFCQFTNPSNSGVLAVIERMQVSTITLMGYAVVRRWPTMGNGSTGTTAKGVRDTRATPSAGPLPVCLIDGGHDTLANITAGSLVQLQNIPLLQSVNGAQNMAIGEFVDKMVLGPGTSILIHGGTDQRDISINFSWRERTLEPSEV